MQDGWPFRSPMRRGRCPARWRRPASTRGERCASRRRGRTGLRRTVRGGRLTSCSATAPWRPRAGAFARLPRHWSRWRASARKSRGGRNGSAAWRHRAGGRVPRRLGLEHGGGRTAGNWRRRPWRTRWPRPARHRTRSGPARDAVGSCACPDRSFRKGHSALDGQGGMPSTDRARRRHAGPRWRRARGCDRGAGLRPVEIAGTLAKLHGVDASLVRAVLRLTGPGGMPPRGHASLQPGREACGAQ